MLTWLDLLQDLTKHFSKYEYIRVSDIANHYNMPIAEASVRLKRLHNWGYLRYFDIKQRGYGGYVLTQSAYKRIAKKEKNGED